VLYTRVVRRRASPVHFSRRSHERYRRAAVVGPDQRLVDVVVRDGGRLERHRRGHVHAIGGHRRDRSRIHPREARLGPDRRLNPVTAPSARRSDRRRHRRRRCRRRRRRDDRIPRNLIEMIDARARHAQVPVATAILVFLGHARRAPPHRRPIVVVHGEPQLLRRLQAAASVTRTFLKYTILTIVFPGTS